MARTTTTFDNGETHVKSIEPLDGEEDDEFSRRMREILQPIVHNIPLLEPMAHTIQASDVAQSLKHMSQAATAGLDGVSTAFLKCLPPEGLECVATIFNTILETGSTPEQFHRALITMIPKAGKPQGTFANSRPITVLPALWRLLGNIMQTRFADLIFTHGLVDATLFGNLKGKSATQMVARAAAMFENAAGNKQHLFCTLSDYSKCFDTIQFRSTELALRRLGVPNKVTTLIRNMQKNQKRWITTQGIDHASPPFTLAAGIAQGDALSPILLVCITDAMLAFIGCSCNTGTEKRGVITKVNDDDEGSCDVRYADIETHQRVIISPEGEKTVGKTVKWRHRDTSKCGCDPYVVDEAPCTTCAKCAKCTIGPHSIGPSEGQQPCTHGGSPSCMLTAHQLRMYYHSYVDDSDWLASSWAGLVRRSNRHAAVATYFGLAINHSKTFTLCTDPTKVRSLKVTLPPVLWENEDTPRTWTYEPLAPTPGEPRMPTGHVLLGNEITSYVKARPRDARTKTTDKARKPVQQTPQQWLDELWVSSEKDQHAIRHWVAIPETKKEEAGPKGPTKYHYGFARVVLPAASHEAEDFTCERKKVILRIEFNEPEEAVPDDMWRKFATKGVALSEIPLAIQVHAAWPHDERKYDAAFERARRQLVVRVARLRGRHNLSLTQIAASQS